MTNEILALAKTIWDYHHVNHTLAKADCLLALGSHDTRVAERAAQLWLQGYAPLLVFSGGLGRHTDTMWTKSEAELFAGIALQLGVPASAILLENKSTNTGENIVFTKALFLQKGIDANSFIVVQKPYMERRSMATFKKHWPEKELMVTSPQIPFEEYTTPDIPIDFLIEIMVGDLQRIKLYAEKGFQISQEVPEHVWKAYEQLVTLGYDKQLMR